MGWNIDISEIAVRWTARAAALASSGLLILFIADGLHRGAQLPTSVELLGLAFFPAGLLYGFALGFKDPKTGGLIALASMLCFYGWHMIVAGRLPEGPYFLLLTAPAFLYLVSGWMLDYRATLTP